MKKFMKFVLAALAAAFVFNGAAMAADAFGDFKLYAGKTYLKPFARDFGGLIGGSDFNSGRAVGFPGFDVGVTAVVQSKPAAANKILKNANVKAFGLPLLHASVGLPVVGADIGLRGMSISGLSVMGAGVTYPVFKSGTLTKFIPDVAVSAFYDVINYDYFKGSHMSFDVSASLDFPVIKPFAGIGCDRTKIEAKGLTGATEPVNGASGAASGERFTLGVKLVPLPLTYVFGAYSILHGIAGYQAGLGVKF